jgi:hypothetical protein
MSLGLFWSIWGLSSSVDCDSESVLHELENGVASLLDGKLSSLARPKLAVSRL